MSIRRGDGHGSTATAVALACVVALVLFPVVTAAGQAPATGGQVAGTPQTLSEDRPSTSCEGSTPPIGSESLNRDRVEANPNHSPGASTGTETVPLGGIAFVTLSVAAGLNSTLVVSDGTNYTVDGTVADDGDGEATLRINTYAAANATSVGSEAYSLTGPDDLTIRTNETDGPMTNQTYRIAVNRDGTVVDEVQLTVTPPDYGTVTAFSGPPQLHDAGTLDAVQTAQDLGMLSDAKSEYNDTVVRKGEIVVLRIESPSFLGAVAAQPGATTTEQLGYLSRSNDYDRGLEFTIWSPCYLLDYDEAIEANGLRVLSDFRNGTLYLIVDHERTDGLDGSGRFQIVVERPNPLGTDSDVLTFESGTYSYPEGRPVLYTVGENGTWELSSASESERVDRIPIKQLQLEDGGFLVAYRPVDNATAFQRIGAAGPRAIAMSVAPITDPAHLVVVAHRDGNNNGRFDGGETDPPYRVDGDVLREWTTVEVADEVPPDDPPLGSFAFSKVGDPAEDAPVGTTVEPIPTATPTPTQTPTSTATETTPQTPTQTPTTAPTPTPTDRSDAKTAATTTSAPSKSRSTAETRTGETSADGPGFGAGPATGALVSLGAVLARRRT